MIGKWKFVRVGGYDPDAAVVERLAREVVRANGYSAALLLLGDRMFNATTSADAARWKGVADWLMAHPEVAHASR